MSKKSKAIEATPDLTVWRLLRSKALLLALSVLLITINRAAGLVWPYMSKYLVDDVLTRRSQAMLVIIVCAGAAATGVQGVTAYLINRTVNVSALRLVAELRKRIHSHVMRLSISYYDANKSGALASRIISDVDGIRTVFGGGLVSFLGAVVTALIAFVLLLQINAVMTLTVFLVLVPFGLVVRNGLRKYRPYYREANALRAEMTGRLMESLGGIRVVKAYRAEGQEHGAFAGMIDRHLQKVTFATRGQGFLDLMVVLMTGTVSAAITYLSSNAIMSGRMTLGDFFRYVMLMGVLIQPLLQAVSIGTQFNEAFAGLERIKELLVEPREDQDAGRSLRIGPIKGEVCFESVSFSYAGGEPVLQEVSFRAEPGTVTALVGPSGAGKSTIIGMIAGFYKVQEGKVWVDDTDLARTDLDGYRAQLGIVPQDPFLFSGTIRDNVAFSRPCATDEEVLRACRLVHVDEFASKFEAAYETVVGERGVKLSMGQRQRIAIARAILADPRILILDEATSSLDSVSEAVIQEALTALLRGRTTFIIAHRLSTIRRADQILVVDGGQIVERGTHESLLGAKGKYWKLYTTQHQLQSNLFLAPGEGECPPAAEKKASRAGVDVGSGGQ
jgi:ABC-type multidrug transport system fused ATPase/permease subunit